MPKKTKKVAKIAIDIETIPAVVAPETRKTHAIAFINEIRTMEPARLNKIIVEQAGQELAEFFLGYSQALIARDPERVLENTSSLLLMGYLMAKDEVAKEVSHVSAGPVGVA